MLTVRLLEQLYHLQPLLSRVQMGTNGGTTVHILQSCSITLFRSCGTRIFSPDVC